MTVKIVTFSSSGGAGKASLALETGFNKIGIGTELITATKSNLREKPLADVGLTVSAGVDNYLLKSSKWPSLISLTRDSRSAELKRLGNAEMTIFRWMNGILGREFLAVNPQISNLVWTLDDMNPFTGTCHHSGDCMGYESNCSNCPALRHPFKKMATPNLEKKMQLSSAFGTKYVAPTDWIGEKFAKSSLGSNSVCAKIHNPLSSIYFEPFRRAENLGSKIQILIVAANLDDKLKGVWDVINTLIFFTKSENLDLTLIGRYSHRLRKTLPNAVFLGSMPSREVMNQLRGCDVLLVPSLFENAGTVVAEAASQGLPTIARNVGGMPEMTNYGKTGYLFKNEEQLSQILESLESSKLFRKGLLAKEWAQQLKPELIAAQYAETFL